MKYLLSFCLCTAVVWAQQTGIRGRIADSSGGALASAAVRLTDKNSGNKLATVTTEEGIYSFPAMLAGEYVLRVDAPGFTPAERSFAVLVGQVLDLDLQLRPAAISSTVEVQAEGAGVEATSSQVAGQIDPRQMKEVPLNGRNWMELALLVPGVTRNAASASPDSIGKMQINVDGQQVTQNTAGTGSQAQYSRDAIAEFQIITNRFDATLGRSSRLQVNAQTKSGTNDLHGTGYAYFRNDRFNAADKIARRVLPYSNQQFGGTVGGAIIKNKLWFFGAYEAEREPGTAFLTPIGFEGQSFSLASKTDSRSILARADYQRNETSRFALRLSASHWYNPFTNVTGNSHPSRATDSSRDSKGALLSWSKTISSALVSDAKLGFVYHSWTNDPLVQSQEYRLGNTTIGAPYNFPGDRFQNTFQLRDDLYYLKGRHSFKGGVDYLNTRHYGFFQQNVRGVVTSVSRVPPNLASVFPAWNDPSTWRLDVLSPVSNSYVQGFGDFNLNVRRHTLGLWIQDDWKFTPKLTLNLGLRYDNDIGMVGSSPRLRSGLRTPERGDNNNWAPRLGFAYDVTGARRMVIRGGVGLYFADIQANQYYNQQLFNGETTIQASIDARPGAPIDLARPFGSVTGDDFVSGRAVAPRQSLQLVDPGVVTPYSLQSSIGFEKAFGKQWTIQADYVNWRVYREWVRTDENLLFDPATGFNQNPNRVARPDNRFTSILRFTTPRAGGAIYNGLQVEVRRSFNKGLALASSYTLARLKDSTTGPFYVPNNQFDLAGEWGNGADDQRNTFNVNGSWTWKYGVQFSGLYRIGSGSAYSVTAAGSPFANGGTNRTFAANTRTYNDPRFNRPARLASGFLITDRNQSYGTAIHRADVRATKTFTYKERIRFLTIVEAFNLFNRANFGAFNSAVTSASFGAPAQNSNLAYAARMLQFAGRIEF